MFEYINQTSHLHLDLSVSDMMQEIWDRTAETNRSSTIRAIIHNVPELQK